MLLDLARSMRRHLWRHATPVRARQKASLRKRAHSGLRDSEAPSRTTKLKPLSSSAPSELDAASLGATEVMRELNRFIHRDPRGSAALCAIIVSNIGANQTYSDFMARRTACDFTTHFKPVAGMLASRTLKAIAAPMATACSSVKDEGSSPAAVVGTGVDGTALVPL